MDSTNQITREDWKEVERLLLKSPDVRLAMAARCVEQGHQFENGLTATFQVIETCKWCHHRRYFR